MADDRIANIAEATLKLEPETRQAYLEDACDDDQDLLKAVTIRLTEIHLLPRSLSPDVHVRLRPVLPSLCAFLPANQCA